MDSLYALQHVVSQHKTVTKKSFLGIPLLIKGGKVHYTTLTVCTADSKGEKTVVFYIMTIYLSVNVADDFFTIFELSCREREEAVG